MRRDLLIDLSIDLLIHLSIDLRGYIAMLAVDDRFRKKGIGSTLV